jgi:hypothetical protein
MTSMVVAEIAGGGRHCYRSLCLKLPTMKNGGRGKNSHQRRANTTSTKKIWADVVRNGGINVQIVLGKGNLGLTTPTKITGERQGGLAWRLAKRGVDGDRDATGRGKDRPEERTSRGNKDGQMGKNGRGRVEERGEPGMVASV